MFNKVFNIFGKLVHVLTEKKINLILGTNQSVTILTLKYVPSKIRVGIYIQAHIFRCYLWLDAPSKKVVPKDEY